jgi:hypothetical protein
LGSGMMKINLFRAHEGIDPIAMNLSQVPLGEFGIVK